MITVKGRQLVIPKADEWIGCKGDHNVETRTFELPLMYGSVDLSALNWKLDTSIGVVKDIIDLEKSVGERVTLIWTVEESNLPLAGYMSIQLRGLAADGSLKWHSEPAYVRVTDSIGASEAQPAVLPSEFAQMELRVTQLKNDTEAAREEAAATLETIQGITAVTIGETEPDNGLWIKELM